MALTRSDLAQFTATEHWYWHWTRSLLYTNGIAYLVDHGAAWLVDAIASYQGEAEVRTNQRLQEFQLWELEVRRDHSALLTCREDSGLAPVVQQEVPYTDFPFSIALYVEPGEAGPVLLLPSEH